LIEFVKQANGKKFKWTWYDWTIKNSPYFNFAMVICTYRSLIHIAQTNTNKSAKLAAYPTSYLYW